MRYQLSRALVRCSVMAATWLVACQPNSEQRVSAIDALTVAEGGVCALGHNSAVACWPSTQSTPGLNQNLSVLGAGGIAAGLHAEQNSTRLEQITLGERTICGVYSDHSWTCWHDGSSRGIDVSSVLGTSKVTDLAIRGFEPVYCAAISGGGVRCGGSELGGTLSFGASDVFEEVVLGTNHVCALSDSKQARCWLLDEVKAERGQVSPGSARNFGQAQVPENLRFNELAAGLAHTCGITIDKRVLCWGAGKAKETEAERQDTASNEFRYHFGQSLSPDTQFTSVVAGDYHSCGLRADGRVRCWGLDNFGQSSPPSRKFAKLAAGADSTCGIVEDGGIECWGKQFGGQFQPNPDAVR